MSAKKKLPRTIRRETERAQEKLARDRMRLAALEPGGVPSNPIEVVTPALVESHAASMPCARCGGSVRVEEHTAEVIDGARLRVAKTRCAPCGAVRLIYFRIGTALIN